jgi:HEAT repeat protein
MHNSTVDELFAQTLRGEYDDAAAWDAIRALRLLGSQEIFDQAAEWCRSKNALQRARGADVLAQLGKTAEHPSNRFPQESYNAISGMLLRETDAKALAAAITALGHLDNPAAIALVSAHHNHSDPDVRYAVAFALGCFPNDVHSVLTLLNLMEDSNEDVRDWATFALGVLGSANSAEILDALFRRINDPDDDVREEAMVGLAKRQDRRVLPALIAALESTPVSVRVIEAAAEMLRLETPPKAWSPQQYAAALKAQFRS